RQYAVRGWWLSTLATNPLKAGRYLVAAAAPVVVAVVVVREGKLPDGAALRAEPWNPRRRADAIGAEVEIAIRPHHVHVGEIEPGRDHRRRPRFGVELDDVAGERLRGRRRRPHVDEVHAPLPVRGAAGQMLEAGV